MVDGGDQTLHHIRTRAFTAFQEETTREMGMELFSATRFLCTISIAGGISSSPSELGMTRTGQGNACDVFPHRAGGYTSRVGEYIHCELQNMCTSYGAGSLRSTIGDPHRWDRPSLRQAPFSPHDLSMACPDTTRGSSPQN